MAHASSQQQQYNWTIIARILDELPPISRCLLRTIIDHLKLILAYRHSNKLTADQLSSIFGPLLFLSSRTAAVVFPNPYQPCRALLRELLHYWPGQQGESMLLISEDDKTTSSSAMSPPRSTATKPTIHQSGGDGGGATSSSSQGTVPSVIEMPHVQQMREYYESQTRQLQPPPPPAHRRIAQQAATMSSSKPLRAEPVRAVAGDDSKPA